MPLSAVTARPLLDLMKYWQWRTPAGASYPSREAIDPLDIPRVLPYLILADVHRDPLSFHIRVWGTHVRDIFGVDLGGVRVNTEDVQRAASYAVPRVTEVVNTGIPVAGQNPVPLPGRDHVAYQTAHFPLGPANGPVTHTLSGVAEL